MFWLDIPIKFYFFCNNDANKIYNKCKSSPSVEGWLKIYVLGLCKILFQNIVLLSHKDKTQLSFAKLQHD